MSKKEIRVEGKDVFHGTEISLRGRGRIVEETDEGGVIEFSEPIPSSVAIEEVEPKGGPTIRGKIKVK